MELVSKSSFLLFIIIAKLAPICCVINHLKYDFNYDSDVDIEQREIAMQNRDYVLRHAQNGVMIYPHFNTILSSLLDIMSHWGLQAVTLLTDDTYFASATSKLSVVRWFESRGFHLIFKMIHSLNDNEIKRIEGLLSEDRDVIIMCRTNHTDTLIKLGNQALYFRNWFIVQSDMPSAFKKMAYGRNQFILVSPNYFGKSYETLLNSEISMRNIFFIHHLGRWDMTKFASWSSQKRLNLLSDFDKDDAVTKFKKKLIRFVMYTELACGYVYEAFVKISALLNFSIYCVGPDSGQFGIETNGTFDGMIGQIQKKGADIAGVSLVMGPNRARVVRFVSPVVFSTLSIWYRPANATVSPIAHLRVFSWPTWLCASVALITMAAILAYALFNFSTLMNKKSQHLKKWIFNGQIIIDILNNMPGMSNKLLAGVFYLWVLAMFAHYNSVLKSFLIYKHQETIFRNLKDVADRKDYRVLLVKGAVLNDYFKFSDNEVHQEIYRRVQSNPANLVDEIGVSACLCGEKAVLIELNKYMDNLLSHADLKRKGPPCELVNKPQAHFKTLTHLAFRKDFPFENIFRTRFLKAFEGGVYNRESKKESYKKNGHRKKDMALSIYNMIAPIGIITAGIICALIVLLVEMFLHRKQ